MFINLSNHPSANWSAEQKTAAEQLYGEIIDLPFPQVDPHGDENYIVLLADEYCLKVKSVSKGQPTVVHLMGEMTFTYAIVSRLKTKGITCVASTTERMIKMMPDGKKVSEFKFVQFREY